MRPICMKELKVRGKDTKAREGTRSMRGGGGKSGSGRTLTSQGENFTLALTKRRNRVFAGFGVLLAPQLSDPPADRFS